MFGDLLMFKSAAIHMRVDDDSDAPCKAAL